MPSPSDEALELDDDLRATADVLRRLTPADRALETPPASIWAAIEAELASDDAGPVVEGRAGEPESDVVVDLSSERSRRRPIVRLVGLAAAAVIVVVAGVGVVIAATGNGDTDEVLARADLATLDTEEVVGAAELLGTDDDLRLEVQLPSGADPGDGYFELWLINDEVTELVSLGPLTASTATLPAGLDPQDFPVVDVSFEPFDGDPAHSGNSLVRGRLAV